MDKATIEQHIEAAGPDGRLAIRFRDYLVPQLDENAEAVHELIPQVDEAGNAVLGADGNPVMVPEGPVIHVQYPVGISRTVSAYVVKVIDNHIALGRGPGFPIEHLIAFEDIEAVRPDPADHENAVIRAGTPEPTPAAPTPVPIGPVAEVPA